MSGLKVLLIDDDSDAGSMLQESLIMRGIDTRWVTSLPATVNEANPVDIIVLDLQMPGADGFMTLDQIAHRHSSAQIVIASAQPARIISAAANSAAKAGLNVIGVLEKPYAISALIALFETPIPPVRREYDDAGAVTTLLASPDLANHIAVHYQSKRALGDGRVVGYEALARVFFPTPISPEALFGDDVSLQAKINLTALIVRKVVADWSIFEACGEPLPIAINCPPSVFCDDRFLSGMRDLAKAGTVPSGMLELELTEHPSTEQLHQIARAASQLVMLGFSIAIDDFGRGSTSLEKITILPIANLKIDRETFWESMESTVAFNLLREVVTFCRFHGIATTIEGIETDIHRINAIELGADFAQGYLWDRPESVFKKHEGNRDFWNSSAVHQDDLLT